MEISQIGFEKNGIIAFYRKPKNVTVNEKSHLDWSQMEAIYVRQYWYEILYKRIPEIQSRLSRTIIFYDEV